MNGKTTAIFGTTQSDKASCEIFVLTSTIKVSYDGDCYDSITVLISLIYYPFFIEKSNICSVNIHGRIQ